MRRFVVVALVAAALACGTGVREVRSVAGQKIFEAKCKSAVSDCIADARAMCSEGYEVLDSEAHAGGLAADVMPGPVTWYTLTFKCGVVAGAAPPSFPFRGQQYRPAPTQTPASDPAVTTTTRGCSNDFDCRYGHRCVKQQFQMTGACAEVVDQLGTPTHSAPRTDSFGPGGEGTCSFDTDCNIGFHCIKGSALTGHCMK